MAMKLGEVKSRIAEKLTKASDAISQSGQVDLVAYSSQECFSELSKDWNKLVELSHAPFCVTREWVSLWWKCFGENRNRLLNVVVIKDEGKVIAIAPFYIGFSNIGKGFAITRLQIIGSGGSKNEQWGYPNDYGISDFLDIIVHPDHHDVASNKLANLIEKYVEFIDEMKFLQLRDDSFVKKELHPKIENKDLDEHLEVIDECSYVDLKGIDSIKDYIKKNNSSSARRRLRQTLRAINDDEEFEIKEAKTESEIQNAKDRLIELHQDRWNEIGYPGVFHDNRFREFFDGLLEACIENDWLYFKETIDADGVSSSRMLVHFDGKYYDYLSGFDPESPSSKYRPGYGLLLDVIEEAITNNTRYVELLRGQEGYKHDFTDKKQNNWVLTIKGNQKKNLISSSVHKGIKIAASLYSIIAKESILLTVQYETVGVLKAFPKYFSFRWDTVKQKLG